jgi:hypothetical protein
MIAEHEIEIKEILVIAAVDANTHWFYKLKQARIRPDLLCTRNAELPRSICAPISPLDTPF